VEASGCCENTCMWFSDYIWVQAVYTDLLAEGDDECGLGGRILWYSRRYLLRWSLSRHAEAAATDFTSRPVFHFRFDSDKSICALSRSRDVELGRIRRRPSCCQILCAAHACGLTRHPF
jgi:hypothetical protein